MRVREHVRVRICDGIESAFVVVGFFSVGSFSFEFQNKVKQNEWKNATTTPTNADCDSAQKKK